MPFTLAHYYGHIVRYLFLAAAVLMIITLPLFYKYLNVPIIFSVFAIAVLGIAAGLTNPKQISSAIVNFVVSCFGFIIFGYVAVKAYENITGDDKYIITTVALALIFLFSIYFSMKTLRAELIADLPGPDPHANKPDTEEKINF